MPEGELGVTEHTSHPAPVRAAAGRAGPFVAVRAAEPVSSRMRRGRGLAGSEEPHVGNQRGRRFLGRRARRAVRLKRVPLSLGMEVLVSRRQLWAQVLWAGLTALPGVEAREKRKRLSLGLVEQLVKPTPRPLSVSLSRGSEWHPANFLLSSRRKTPGSDAFALIWTVARLCPVLCLYF